jgi:hypothetical protein
MQRQRTSDGMKASGTAHAEARSRRHRTGDRTKVAAWTFARSDTLLECQKVFL